MAKKKKKEEPKIEEKHFVVSFSQLFNYPRPKRAYRAINYLKKFAFKHLRTAAKDVAISQALNQAVWAKGREHIPRRLEVKIVKDKEKATIYLEKEKVEKPKKEEKKKEEKKAAETKEEKEAKEEIEKKKEEKKAKEKAAEAADIKRGTGKEK